MTSWHRTPPPPPQREWCRWHTGWVLETDAVLVVRIPNGEGLDYGQYACNSCAKEHQILPADDSGEIRYRERASAK